MARRITFDPVKARQDAANQLTTLLNRFDLAELQAQTYAPQMVDFIARVALDPTITAADIPVLTFKTGLAKDIIARAYGMPATKSTVTVHRAEDLAPDSKIAADIAAAGRQAEEFRQVDMYLQQPVETWPEWMRERFMASGTPFQLVEDDSEGEAAPAAASAMD